MQKMTLKINRIKQGLKVNIKIDPELQEKLINFYYCCDSCNSKRYLNNIYNFKCHSLGAKDKDLTDLLFLEKSYHGNNIIMTIPRTEKQIKNALKEIKEIISIVNNS